MQTLTEKIQEVEKNERKAAIAHVNSQIRVKRIDFNETELFHVAIAKYILDNAMVGMESGYALNQDSINLYKILANSKLVDKKAQEPEIKKVREEIKASKRRLNYLITNPKEFYESKDATELSALLTKMFNNYF
jgi:hypothetical protein